MVDKAAEVPLKESRERCWNQRDGYWDCLDANGEDESKCTELRKAYEAACSSTWVRHFDRKRRFEKFKGQLSTQEAQENAAQRLPELRRPLNSKKSDTSSSQ